MAFTRYPNYASLSWRYRGIDTADYISPTRARQMYADGVRVVGRYIGEAYSVTRAEVNGIITAGLNLFLYYERGAYDPAEGYDQGVLNGRRCKTACEEVGVPSHVAIYVAVDFGPQDYQLTNVVEYMRGFASEMSGYTLGVYGGYKTINAVKNALPYFLLCQAGAWNSYGSAYDYVEDDRIDCRQWQNGQWPTMRDDGYISFPVNEIAWRYDSSVGWIVYYRDYFPIDFVSIENTDHCWSLIPPSSRPSGGISSNGTSGDTGDECHCSKLSQNDFDTMLKNSLKSGKLKIEWSETNE